LRSRSFPPPSDLPSAVRILPENDILAERSAQSLCHPAAYSQRISLEELTEILGDNEAVFAHVMAIWANGEWIGSSPATLLGDGR
jgi:hypothetical protein